MDIEQSYKAYLSKLRLKDSDFSSEQRTANREAFVAGVAAVMIGIKNSPDPKLFLKLGVSNLVQYYKDTAMDYAEKIIEKQN